MLGRTEDPKTACNAAPLTGVSPCMNTNINVGRYAWAVIVALSVALAGFGVGEIVLGIAGLVLLSVVAGALTTRLSSLANQA